jgi:hypothetical protein
MMALHLDVIVMFVASAAAAKLQPRTLVGFRDHERP